jgi:hypothetical protein
MGGSIKSWKSSLGRLSRVTYRLQGWLRALKSSMAHLMKRSPTWSEPAKILHSKNDAPKEREYMVWLENQESGTTGVIQMVGLNSWNADDGGGEE